MFSAATQSILSIILMILVGYVLTIKKWFNEEASNLLVRLVTQVSLPALMISTLLSNFTKEQLISSAWGLIVPFLSMVLGYFIGIAAGKILKVDRSRKGLFISMFFNSNTIFMGLPINLALFGTKSIPFVLLYYMANTTMFWTIGIYEIQKDGITSKRKLFSINSFKKILSPPLLGYLFGMLLLLLNIHLPQALMDSCKYLGNLTTPLSMIFIGITICSVPVKDFKVNKEMIGVLIGRFLVSPMLVVLLSIFFPMPKLMRDVFIVQAAMPVMTNSAIISKSIGADHKYAAVMITISTLAIFIVIPFYMHFF